MSRKLEESAISTFHLFIEIHTYGKKILIARFVKFLKSRNLAHSKKIFCRLSDSMMKRKRIADPSFSQSYRESYKKKKTRRATRNKSDTSLERLIKCRKKEVFCSRNLESRAWESDTDADQGIIALVPFI